MGIRARSENNAAKITVVGIGGAGIQILNGMIKEQAASVEYIGMDTDMEALKLCKAPKLLQLDTIPADGAYMQGKLYQRQISAAHNAVKISAALADTDMAFILCGMGGSTGTGYTCAVAEIARVMGIFTVAIVTSPFYFEEKAHIINAANGIKRLRAIADSITIIANDRALGIADTTKEALAKSDNVMSQMIWNIAAMISASDLINLSIHDVQCAMTGWGGLTYIGIGEGSRRDMGEEAVVLATMKAMHSPWQATGLRGADRVLLHIAGDITLKDVDETSRRIREKAGSVLMICGVRVNQSDTCTVTVIATGTERNITLGECEEWRDSR